MVERASSGPHAPPAVSYREEPPPTALARAVFCRWTLVVGHGDDHVQRVLPDGCVDLVWVAGSAPFAAGPATRTDEARLPPGTVVVGLRFRPGWASLGLGTPASDLLDRDVKLTDLWSGASQPLVEDALERLGPHRHVDRPALIARAHLGALERALIARRHPLERPRDPLPPVAAAWLARHPSGRVEQLARDLAMSPRQLQRRFAAAVGYGPKTFQRIARFQRLLALASPPSATRPGLGELALEAGYADQAHMTREVGELSGRPPTAMVGVTGSALAGAELFAAPADGLTGTTRGRR